jgi:hypothetical protein
MTDKPTLNELLCIMLIHISKNVHHHSQAKGVWDLADKEETARRPRKMQDMMKGAFKEGMKDDMMKGVKRSMIVLLLAVVCWIVFVTAHSFLWSTSFTFYQNLVITCDALLIAMVIGLLIIYRISGLGEMIKKFKSPADETTQDKD